MRDVGVSVIIPAHNAAGTLGAQLDALHWQRDAPAFEVLVVTNRCTDTTADVAVAFADRLAVRVVIADEKPSAAYARNVGAEHANGEVLLFCDADDRAGPYWVAGMAAELGPGRSDFVGGLIQVDREGLPTWIYRWRYAGVDNTCARGDLLPHVISASFGVTAEAFAGVGGFDEGFAGAAGEDVDVSRRLLRQGYRLAAAPTATIRYTPRRNFKGALAQARAYSRADIILAARESNLQAWSRRAAVRDVVKHVAHSVIREHEYHPLALYGRGRQRHDRWREHRLLERSGPLPSGGPPDHFDFTVDRSTAIIGGLAFAADRPGAARWYATEGVERSALEALNTFLPKNGVFVDVGANIGLFTVAAAKHLSPRGRVVAFEPGHRARQLLDTNLRRHNVTTNVEVRSEAAGETHSTQAFLEYENTQVSGLGPAPDVFTPGRVVSDSDVRVVPLSEAIAGPVNMVKIDVEGFEIEVLRGATDLIERSPDLVILFEVNPTALTASGRTIEELVELFPPSEWDLRLIDERSDTPLGQLPRIDRECLALAFPGGERWYGSLLATRHGRDWPERAYGPR